MTFLAMNVTHTCTFSLVLHLVIKGNMDLEQVKICIGNICSSIASKSIFKE